MKPVKTYINIKPCTRQLLSMRSYIGTMKGVLHDLWRMLSSSHPRPHLNRPKPSTIAERNQFQTRTLRFLRSLQSDRSQIKPMNDWFMQDLLQAMFDPINPMDQLRQTNLKNQFVNNKSQKKLSQSDCKIEPKSKLIQNEYNKINFKCSSV